MTGPGEKTTTAEDVVTPPQGEGEINIEAVRKLIYLLTNQPLEAHSEAAVENTDLDTVAGATSQVSEATVTSIESRLAARRAGVPHKGQEITALRSVASSNDTRGSSRAA